jgi:hypothetical protein
MTVPGRRGRARHWGWAGSVRKGEFTYVETMLI